MTSRVREKMDEKEGEGEEVREEKKLKESLQIYVYRLKKEKLLVPLAPRERREKSATSGETSGNVDNGCCLMSNLQNSFRHFTQRLFVPFFLS